MDYKALFPVPVGWSIDQLRQAQMPEPYDRFYKGALLEIESVNYPTQFLLMTFDLNEETGFFTDFAIEAPRDCDMRHAFEWGEISWQEFWNHRGWLLKVDYSFAFGKVSVNYITPKQLPATVTDLFDSFDRRGPYLLKLEHLERLVENVPNSRHAAEHRRAYQDFILRHGHKFYKKAFA